MKLWSCEIWWLTFYGPPCTCYSVTVTVTVTVTFFNELFSEESCSVIGLSEKMGFQLWSEHGLKLTPLLATLKTEELILILVSVPQQKLIKLNSFLTGSYGREHFGVVARNVGFTPPWDGTEFRTAEAWPAMRACGVGGDWCKHGDNNAHKHQKVVPTSQLNVTVYQKKIMNPDCTVLR